MKLKHCLFMHTEAGSSDDWSKLLSSDPRNRFLSRLINPVILIGWKQAFDMIYIVKVKQMWVVKVLSSMLKFFPGHSPIDLPGKAPRLLQYKGAIPPYLPLVNVPHMIAFRNLFPPPYFFFSFFKFSGKPWVRCACSLMWWQLIDNSCVSLGKQLMFWNAITDFPAKWWLNLHTVVCYYLDLGMLRIGGASRESCFNQSEALLRCGQWQVTSMKFLAVIPQTLCHRETSDGIAKCQLSSQASIFLNGTIIYYRTWKVNGKSTKMKC